VRVSTYQFKLLVRLIISLYLELTVVAHAARDSKKSGVQCEPRQMSLELTKIWYPHGWLRSVC